MRGVDVSGDNPLPAEAVTDARPRGLETQGTCGDEYRQYWFDEGSGKVFCLVEAPDMASAERVHRDAHGLTADELMDVREGA